MDKNFYATRRINKEILVALHNAKMQIGSLVKNKTAQAGKYSYDYINLNLILSLDPVLFEHGLVFVDAIQPCGVLTTLFHVETSQYIESFFPFDTPAHGREGIIDGLNFQDNGKTVTYGKRYNRLSILGLPQDDADTEEPVTRKPATGSKTKATTTAQSNDNPW